MKLLHGLCAAFAMYSALPTPQIAWGGDSLRWALACFPLVGAVLGGLFWGWGWLASWLGLGAPLTAAVWLCLIVGVSGGIHLDGFCDTVDALASHQPAARKLEILKDSHVG
ncbi:MAG: adenosylcobinamide-GDP ribazoletransferase, partial [Oscillospiraceae bacterium]